MLNGTAHHHNLSIYIAIHVGSHWKIQDRRQIDWLSMVLRLRQHNIG